MTELMPNELFKSLEKSGAWALHEKLDPYLKFNDLKWCGSFGWGIPIRSYRNSDIDYLDDDFYIDFDSNLELYFNYELYFDSGFNFNPYFDSEFYLDLYLDFIFDLARNCGVLE